MANFFDKGLKKELTGALARGLRPIAIIAQHYGKFADFAAN